MIPRPPTSTLLPSATPSRSVSFTIHGANDAAVIGTPTVADVTEDIAVSAAGTLTATGAISITDVDTREDHFKTAAIAGACVLGTLVLAADDTYSSSFANAAVPFLAGSAVYV